MLSMKYVLLTGVCFLLFACGGQNSPRVCLDAAQAVVCDNPDSALSLLRGVGSASFRSSKLRARRALLYTEALDKAGVNVDDDSLIRIAVRYYSRHGEAEQRAKAYYYLARVYENNHELDTAVKSLVRAEELASLSGNRHLHGLIAESFGRLHLSQYHLPEARKYYEQAITCYHDCGVRLNEGLCYNQLAKIFAFEKQFEEATRDYQSAMGVFYDLKDTTNLLRSAGMMAGLHLRTTNKVREVKQMLCENYSKFNERRVPETDYYLWSVLYINDGVLILQDFMHSNP